MLTGAGERPRAQGAPAARRSLAFGPRTPLNVSITGERCFAAVSLPLDEVKRVARAHEAKLNDVVLAICSGALRTYLSRHGGVPDAPLIAGMPFSLRESGNTEYSTQATMTLVNLATDIADPVQRLRAIRDAAGAIKSVARRAKSVIPIDTPSLGAPWLAGGLAALYGRSGIAGRDAADHERRHLQRSRTGGTAVCRRRADAHLVADVDRRARRWGSTSPW